MNQHTFHLFRWLRPVGLAAIVFAGAVSVSGQTVLTLEEAVSIAMEHSPDVKQTELSLERSQELLNAQNAAMKANFRLSLNPFDYSRSNQFDNRFADWYSSETTQSSGSFSINQPISQTDGTLSLINRFSYRDTYSGAQDLSTKTYDNNLYVQFAQPIFTYNRTKMELQELELDLLNAQYNYAIQRLALENQITQRFYDLYQRKTDLDIAQEELNSQQENYELTVNKVKAGLLAEEELYQAEVNLANSELSYQNAVETLENTKDQFKLLAGMSVHDDIDVDMDIVHTPVTVNLDQALNSAIQNRMELKQQEISLEQAMNNVIRAASQNEFQGELTFSYGLQSTEEDFVDMYDTPTRSQSVGIQLDIPLWDWGEKNSRIRASELTVESQRLNTEDYRNQIIVNVRQAHRNLEKLMLQIDIAEKSERNSQLTYNISLERYRNGDLTAMDLNLQQQQLSQARQNVVAALLSYKLALLELKVLTLYDFENDQPVLPETILGEVD